MQTLTQLYVEATLKKKRKLYLKFCIKSWKNPGILRVQKSGNPVISLLEKAGKDSLYVKNWRPISLLNVDNKIFSKILANRMKNVLPSITHADPTGFMKGRFIGENLIELLNILEYCQATNKEALLISFDFEKAFDRVEWKVLEMEHFNFGNNYRRMIGTMFNSIQSYVINGGIISQWFDLKRGLKQGNPLSSYCFNLIVELLGHKTRKIHRS